MAASDHHEVDLYLRVELSGDAIIRDARGIAAAAPPGAVQVGRDRRGRALAVVLHAEDWSLVVDAVAIGAFGWQPPVTLGVPRPPRPGGRARRRVCDRQLRRRLRHAGVAWSDMVADVLALTTERAAPHPVAAGLAAIAAVLVKGHRRTAMPTIPAATAGPATTACRRQPSGPPARRSNACGGRPPRRVAGFVATVVAANALTATFGLIPVGFGLTATAGTFAAGLTLLARDWVHHTAGRAAVLACIAAGALLSAGLAGPRLALASAAAFGLSELADLLVYQRLRPPRLDPRRRRLQHRRRPDRQHRLPRPGRLPDLGGAARTAVGQDRRHSPSRSPPSLAVRALLRHRLRPAGREAMRAGRLGMIATPAAGNRVDPGVALDRRQRRLHRPLPRRRDSTWPGWPPRAVHRGRCAFATAPDVVGDAAATLATVRRRCCPASGRWATRPRSSPRTASNTSTCHGTPSMPCSWAGPPAWKLGPAAADLAAHARAPRPVGAHGPGQQPAAAALRHGDRRHSADGTHLAYGPRRKLPELLGWLEQVHQATPDQASAGVVVRPYATTRPGPGSPAGRGSRP